MATIKERAKEFAQNYCFAVNSMDCGDCDTCAKCKDYKRYVDILTEQRDIDIEKACVACENELRRLKTLLNEITGVPSNLVSVDESLTKIRREIEESL